MYITKIYIYSQDYIFSAIKICNNNGSAYFGGNNFSTGRLVFSVILFENLKIEFWKLVVIWDLIFVISNSANNVQKITCQLLNSLFF